MGFNKTSDGRVFFSTSSNDDAPHEEQAAPQSSDSAPLTGKPLGNNRPAMLSEADQTQAQILGVLKSVNERLISTKKERDDMRRDLNNYKDIVKGLHAKNLKTTKAITAIEGAEKRFDQLNDKVVNALSKTTQLERKIDKITQDREYIMRKIDRIENQVVQTHELLSAQKPAALIGAQKYSGADDVLLANTVIAPSPRFALDDDVMARPWWRRSKAFGVLALLVLFIAGIVGGWAVNQHQQSVSVGDSIYSSQGIIEPSEATLDGLSLAGADAVISLDPRQNTFGDVSADAQNLFGDQGSATAAEIDVTDDEALNELMKVDPEAVAKTLNEIEPSSIAPAAKQGVEDAVVEEATPVVTSKAQPSNGSNKINLTRDTTLPRSLKKVESQAFAGIAEAQHDLAAIYTAGHGNVAQNYDRASVWFEAAANNGVANAAYNLGVLNHQGIGRKADLEEAIVWYKKAAEADHPEAQYNLGIAYVEGIGVPYDASRASTYFRNAAAQGMMEAAYNLGLIYENGLLGDTRPQQALAWYKIAADSGSAEAKEALAQLASALGISVNKVNDIAAQASTQNVPSSTAPTKAAAQASVVRKTNAVTADLIGAVQQQLMRTGFYPGPANGRMSQLSKDAVRSYQAANKLTIDGKVSQTLLNHLLANSSAGQSRFNQ